MIEKQTEDLDELLFTVIQKFSIENDVRIDQDSDYEKGIIKIKILSK